MKEMKQLYIDFDGVILDTIPLLYEAADAAGRDRRDRTFYREFDFTKILKDEYILCDSINCINKLISSGKFEVSILTHCNSIKEGEDKVNFIRKFFDDITIIICPREISKTKMVHTKGSILVDDYSGNLKEWENEGGIAICFSPDLEDKGYKVIDRLDKLIDMF